MKLATPPLVMLLVLVFASGLPSLAAAQVTTATFYGTVTDTTNAVLPGVNVTLTHQQTGASITKVTDATGSSCSTFCAWGRTR